MADPALVHVPIETHLGEFLAGFSDDGLAELNFPHRHPPQPTIIDNHKSLSSVKRCLLQILSGEHPKQFPKMDLSVGTEFQQAVWLEMLKIPMGQTLTYGEIADNLNNRGAVRAVGMALGALAGSC